MTNVEMDINVCRILLEWKFKDELAEFIMKCPNKFLLTYTNNSESSPGMFSRLKKLGLDSLFDYLIEHVHETKREIWKVRYGQ